METKRPTIPAAEEILGGYFPVLDHGFVALVDYMGSDEDVERAARVSYGYGTRKSSQTRGLIRYLRRHRHTTPSEMVELKFHCAMPMFVARQWIRHRTACLAEGTEVYFDLPGGLKRRGNQLYKLRVEEIWERFQPTRNRTRPDKQRDPFFKRERVRRMHLRQVDEDTLRIGHTRVVDVYRNGPKPVFRMTLADGKSIEATADHRFLFADGWSTLKQKAGLREVNGRAVWEAGEVFVCVNGTETLVAALHRNPAWLDRQYNQLGKPIEAIAEDCGVPYDATLCGPCHREIAGRELDYVERLGGQPVHADGQPRPRVPWNKLREAKLVRVSSFEYVGVKETYDLEVEGPHHNFIANGIVTHNSVNEYSGRYSLMPLLFYTPEESEFALQSSLNRQGRDEPAPADLYRSAVERWEEVRRGAAEGYTWLVGEEVARELARIDLPLSTYTQWYWKIDLHNLFHFLSLRADPHAQWEIQEYARVMAGMLQRVAPLSFEAWVDYQLTGAPMGRGELEVLHHFLEADEEGTVQPREGAEPLDPDALREMGLSGREIRELAEKLRPREIPDFELDLAEMRAPEEIAAEMEDAVPDVDR